ncbi:hypothetical protein [Deinococcus sp. QL22]|uniref:hypothetical protein n=1 Tax=Deinococcus sp. QL22 TaxID=2939437 RepID=UPI002017F146|nr:hypothetical protein [Deinococcus sp. QL22]UQN10354.1 hypothetical protein M1R55_29830 [Deinococcus sp. QL22]UQN10488.1 hypothetical protein M1R55_29155 [Deinococcus sp. QL22]
MKRLLFFLALLLSACSVTVPPRDNAQWTTTVLDTQITWRWVSPGGLGGNLGGYAISAPGGKSCVVDIDPSLSRDQIPMVAAHEAGHCLAGRYLILGFSRPDLGPYFDNPFEGFAQTYALAYLAACGQSLKALGWIDLRPSRCEAPPDPRSIHPPEVP